MENEREEKLRIVLPNFSEWFLFFSDVLQYPTLMTPLSVFLCWISYQQVWFFSLLPVFLKTYQDGNNLVFSRRIFNIVFQYQMDSPDFYGFSTPLLAVSIYLLIMIASTLMLFLLVRNGIHVPKLFFRTRGLLFLYVPSLVAGYVVVFIANGLLSYSINDFRASSLTINIVVAVIVFAINDQFSVFVSPLICSSPVLGSAHCPDHVIPDPFSVRRFYHVFFFSALMMIANDQYTHFVSMGVLIVYGFIYCRRVYLRPYCMYCFTIFSMAVACGFIINPIFAVLCVGEKNFLDEEWLWVAAALGYIASLLVCFGIAEYVDHKESRHMTLHQHVNFSAALRSYSGELIERIDEKFDETKDPELLLLKVYFLVSHFRSIREYIPYLFELVDLCPWIQSFTIFEILQTGCMITEVEPFGDKRFDEFQETIMRFYRGEPRLWSHVVSGRIGMAYANISRQSVNLLKIQREYRRFYHFYNRNPVILECRKSLLLHFTAKDSQLRPISDKNNIFFAYSRTDAEEDDQQMRLTYEEYFKDEAESGDGPKKIVVTKGPMKNLVLCNAFWMVFMLLFVVIANCYAMIGDIDIEALTKLPDTINKTWTAKYSWEDVIRVCESMIDCRETLFTDCSSIMNVLNSDGEISPVVCLSMWNVTSGLYDYSETMMNTMTSQQFDFMYIPAGETMREMWFSRYFELFPSSPSFDQKVHVSMPFAFYGTNVQRLFRELTNLSTLCNSTLADFVRERSFDMLNVSANVDNYFLELLNMMHVLIHNLSEETGNMTRWKATWILFVIAFVVVIAGSTGVLLSNHFNIKKVVTKYFRTRHNPYNPSELLSEGVVESQLSSEVYLFPIVSIIYMVLWFGSTGLCKYLLAQQQVLNLRRCDASVALSISGTIADGLCNYANEINVDLKNRDKYYPLFWEFVKSTGIISGGGTSHLPIQLQYLTDPNGYAASSLHDIYRSWPLPIQMEMFYFYADIVGNPDFPVSAERLAYQRTQLEHIHITHIRGDLREIVDVYSQEAQIQTKHIVMTVIITVVVSLCFFIGALLLFIHAVSVIDSIVLYCNMLVSNLEAIVIASHPSLMEYVLAKRPAEGRKRTESNLWGAMNKADVPIIILNEHFQIIDFTNSALKAIGHFTETQIIGQKINSFVEENDYRILAKRMKMVLKHDMTLSSFQSNVNVVTPDGTSETLSFDITMFHREQHTFFMIEMVSLDQVTHLQDEVIAHEQLFEEISSQSVPFRMLTRNPHGQQGHTYHFNSYTMAIVVKESELATSIYDGCDVMKEQLAEVVPYLSGTDGGILISSSCSHAVLIFVGTNQYGSHVQTALRFVVNYLTRFGPDQCSAVLKCGGNLTIIGTSFAELDAHCTEYEFDGSRPYLTVEPVCDLMKHVPDFVSLLKNGEIFLGSDFLQYLCDVYPTKTCPFDLFCFSCNQVSKGVYQMPSSSELRPSRYTDDSLRI